MATRRGTKKLAFKISVDDRTGNMSDEALFCRSRGHKWGDKGVTRKEYNELIADGLWADNLYCENNCGKGRKVIWSLRTGEVVKEVRTGDTDESYRMPKGQGRLPRTSARQARGARQLAAFA